MISFLSRVFRSPIFKDLEENPAFCAVLCNDIQMLRQVLEADQKVGKHLRYPWKNWEIASFIGHHQCRELLKPMPKKQMRVILSTHQEKMLTPLELGQYFGFDFSYTLRFENYNSFKESCNLSPLWLKWRKKSANNRQLAAFLRRISMGEVTLACSIQWIDKLIGYGLFAEEKIQPEQVIGEYTGAVKYVKEPSKRLNNYCFNYPIGSFWSSKKYYIDGSIVGNETRFINHSDTPNLMMQPVFDRGLMRLALIARQQIEKGEELTYDYGSDYWVLRDKVVRSS